MKPLLRKLAAVICTFPLCAYAQSGPLGFGQSEFTEPMETDRPDFTEGTATVEPGHLQFELGYTYAREDNSQFEEESHAVPELLVRVGAFDNTELRIAWTGYERSELSQAGFESTQSGASDLGVGFKQRVLKDEHLNFSLLGELGLPVGGSEVSSDGVEPAIKFLLASPLSDSVGTAANINLSWLEGDSERYLEAALSFSIAAGLSEIVGVYLEYFGLYPTESVPEDNEHYLNGGFTFLLTPDLQLDARVGMGLNDPALDLFSGAGLSVRF